MLVALNFLKLLTHNKRQAQKAILILKECGGFTAISTVPQVGWDPVEMFETIVASGYSRSTLDFIAILFGNIPSDILFAEGGNGFVTPFALAYLFLASGQYFSEPNYQKKIVLKAKHQFRTGQFPIILLATLMSSRQRLDAVLIENLISQGENVNACLEIQGNQNIISLIEEIISPRKRLIEMIKTGHIARISPLAAACALQETKMFDMLLKYRALPLLVSNSIHK